MITIHKHPQFIIPAISHGWTENSGPDFRGSPQTQDHAKLNHQLASAANLQDAAWVTQVHGGEVLHVDTGSWAGEADGLWTDTPGLGVIGRSADCPIILVGGKKKSAGSAWGFAHASWRSTLAGITASLVDKLMGAGVAVDDLHACICPSAGPCCYEVKNDVVQAAQNSHGQMSEGWFLKKESMIMLDLWRANQEIMIQKGMKSSHIFTDGTCTICSTNYYSFRRDGDAAGRFAAIIGGIC